MADETTNEKLLRKIAEDKPRLLYVKAHPDLGSRMALWDRDPRHPKDAGHPIVTVDDTEFVEVTIDGANPVPVKVAATEAVQMALAPGGPAIKPKLIEVDADTAEKAIATHKKLVAAREAARLQAAQATQVAAAPAVPSQGVPANPRAADLKAANDRAAQAEAELAKLREEIAKGKAQT